jgi:hypothetical protein
LVAFSPEQVIWAISTLVGDYRPHQGLGALRPDHLLSVEGFVPVAYPIMPALNANYPLPRKDQKAAKGLRNETFVAG